MSTFEVKRFRKPSETPSPPTDIADTIHPTPPSVGSGSEGLARLARKPDGVPRDDASTPHHPVFAETPIPPTDRTDRSATPDPFGSSVGEGAVRSSKKAQGPAEVHAPVADAHLPESLARLVRAAASGQLHQTAQLQSPWPGLSGFVPNLGDCVTTWAACYALGGDRPHILARLEAARVAWEQA